MNKKLSEFNFDRTLFLFDYFDQSTSQTLIEGLVKLDQEANEDINIVINSYGGEVYSLFAILDTMKSINSNVNTICLGEADSCGAVLLSAGKERYIGENSRTMIHEVSTMTWGKISEMEEDLKESRKVNDQLITVLAENTNNDFDILSDLMKKDTYLNAGSSLELGLVDFVLDDASLEYEEGNEEVNDFVNSFSGRAKDGSLAMVMCKGVNGSQVPDKPKSSKNAKKIIKEISKGEIKMNKKEMLDALKKEHDMDFNALGAQITDLSAKLAASEKDLKEALDASIAAKEALATNIAEVEAGKIEDILDKLIDDGKSSQVLNDTIYKAAFTALGSEKAAEAAKELKVIAKVKKESVDAVDTSEGLSDKEVEHKEILALAVKDGIGYSEAASKFYTAKDLKAKMEGDN